MNKFIKLIRLFLRQIANICPIPCVRIILIRLSGIVVGKNTFINMNILFTDDYSKKLIYIGERVAIAPMVHIIAVSYPNNSLLRKINEFNKKGKVYINNDCWIGANAVILPDISIGKCSVIAAGAVVTKNVDDYSIVGGIPAKKIGDVREKQSWENILNKL